MRVALVVSLVCGSAAGAAWYSQHGDDDWQAARSTLKSQQERSRQLDERLLQRRRFAAFCDRELFQVVIGAKRLVQACRRIEAEAQVNNPLFLEQLDALGQGKTRREKLANNLASCFATRHSEYGSLECHPTLALRVALEVAEATASQ